MNRRFPRTLRDRSRLAGSLLCAALALVCASVALAPLPPFKTEQPSPSFNTENKASGTTPVEIIGGPTKHLGTVRQGERRDVLFEILNTSGTPMVVPNVRAGCVCTHVDWDRKPVEPGRRAKLRATVAFGQNKGAFRATMTASIDAGGDVADVPLSIDAIVQPDIEWAPISLIFGQHSAALQGVVVSSATLGKPFVKAAVVPHRAFSTKLVALPGGRVEIEITADKSQLPKGASFPQSTFLLLETTSPATPQVQIPIRIVR
jgi:hypothetical protein